MGDERPSREPSVDPLYLMLLNAGTPLPCYSLQGARKMTFFQHFFLVYNSSDCVSRACLMPRRSYSSNNIIKVKARIHLIHS